MAYEYANTEYKYLIAPPQREDYHGTTSVSCPPPTAAVNWSPSLASTPSPPLQLENTFISYYYNSASWTNPSRFDAGPPVDTVSTPASPARHPYAAPWDSSTPHNLSKAPRKPKPLSPAAPDLPHPTGKSPPTCEADWARPARCGGRRLSCPGTSTSECYHAACVGSFSLGKSSFLGNESDQVTDSLQSLSGLGTHMVHTTLGFVPQARRGSDFILNVVAGPQR